MKVDSFFREGEALLSRIMQVIVSLSGGGFFVALSLFVLFWGFHFGLFVCLVDFCLVGS